MFSISGLWLYLKKLWVKPDDISLNVSEISRKITDIGDRNSTANEVIDACAPRLDKRQMILIICTKEWRTNLIIPSAGVKSAADAGIVKLFSNVVTFCWACHPVDTILMEKHLSNARVALKRALDYSAILLPSFWLHKPENLGPNLSEGFGSLNNF